MFLFLRCLRDGGFQSSSIADVHVSVCVWVSEACWEYECLHLLCVPCTSVSVDTRFRSFFFFFGWHTRPLLRPAKSEYKRTLTLKHDLSPVWPFRVMSGAGDGADTASQASGTVHSTSVDSAVALQARHMMQLFLSAGQYPSKLLICFNIHFPSEGVSDIPSPVGSASSSPLPRHGFKGMES